MTAATWWAAGLVAAVVLGPCLMIQLRRAWAALVRRRQARRRAEALLWAETDERRFLATAHRFPYR